MVNDEVLALSHLQRRLNITNPIHGAVLGVAQASGNAQLLLANPSANQTIASGNLTLTSGTFIGAHSGDGSALTALAAGAITTGTLSDGRLSSNVPLKNVSNTFTDRQIATGFTVSGTTGIPTSGGSSLHIVGGSGGSNLGRMIIGDGTGWDVTMVTRSGGVDTVRHTWANGNYTATGTVTANLFSGSGASLTNIPNSATTATATNTNSAIVARDGAGSFSASMITVTGTPSAGTDVATVAYVQSLAAGFDPKGSVYCATAAALAANSRVGNVLTATANGVLTIDGVSPAAGKRVLIKNEANPINNGIYTVTSAGSVGSQWQLTRATDFDGSFTGEVSGGNFVFVENNGTVNANTGWHVLASGDIVVNTDAINWNQFTGAGSFNAGAGMVQNGNTLDIVAADSTIQVNANSIQVGSNSLTDTHINAAAAISWSKISKTGSSLADLATRSASDLSTGTLSDGLLSSNVPLKNAANTFTAAQTISGTAIGTPLSLFRDVNAGDSTNVVQLMIGNSGASQGTARLQYGNAAAASTPSTTWSFQPRNNAGTTTINPANITMTKTAGADTASITLSNTNGSITLNAGGDVTFTDGVTISTGGLAITAGGLTVTAGAVSLPAASIADAALSSNVPLKNGANAFTGANTLPSTTAGASPTGYLGLNANNLIYFDAGQGPVITSSANAIIILDTDNNSTTAKFAIRKDSANMTGGTEVFSVDEAGLVTATTYAGSAANLTSIPAGQLTGTVADARLSTNVPLENANNVFTGQNDFQGKVVIGDGNQDVVEIKSIPIETDTRSEELTYNGDGSVNVVTVKDGVTTVMTTTYAYNVDGTIATKTVVAGGKTITYTYGYTSGNITSVTKTVV